MLGDLIQVYVSWVISNASKHNMWYPKEEKIKIETELTDKSKWRVVGETR